MSLLIKGADVSPDHIQCITVFPEGFAIVEEYEMGLRTEATKCEVMSIPTPHGRLVDAHTAIMLLQKYYDCVGEPLKEHAIGECIMIIKDDAPTIIEAEESEG